MTAWVVLAFDVDHELVVVRGPFDSADAASAFAAEGEAELLRYQADEADLELEESDVDRDANGRLLIDGSYQSWFEVHEALPVEATS